MPKRTGEGRVKTNVLLTSAGRRVALLRAFQDELKARYAGGQVFCADFRPELSPACRASDASYAVPRVDDPSYIDSLLQICIDNHVGVVVPTIDPELHVLSANRERFSENGIQVVVSEPEFVTICRDKRKTAQFLQRCGINTPEIYPVSDLRFPCFAKPYDGSCSADTYFLPDEGAVTTEILNHPTMMFMEYRDLAHHDEVTIDLYYDRLSQLRCIVPRLRLEVRSGEVCKATTREDPYLEELCGAMTEIPGARGCLTLQVFVEHDEGRVFGIEINPRFGGGFPLTYRAGGNFPGWLLDEYLCGQDVPYFEAWERDLLMLRYDDEVMIHDFRASE